MGGTKETIVGTEAPDAEVELSAQDLRELSDACDSEQQGGLTGTPGVPQEKAMATAVPNASAHPPQAAAVPGPHLVSARLGLSVALVIAAVGVLYLLLLSRNDPTQSVAQNLVAQAPSPARSELVTQIKDEAVLFVNPFDADEVFEFPAGTSKEEARDAVAQLLMDRAMERRGGTRAAPSAERTS